MVVNEDRKLPNEVLRVSSDSIANSVVIGQYLLVGKTKRANRPHVLSKMSEPLSGFSKLKESYKSPIIYQT